MRGRFDVVIRQLLRDGASGFLLLGAGRKSRDIIAGRGRRRFRPGRQHTVERALPALAGRERLGPGERGGRIILRPAPRNVGRGLIARGAGGQFRDDGSRPLWIAIGPARENILERVRASFALGKAVSSGESGFGILSRPSRCHDFKGLVVRSPGW